MTRETWRTWILVGVVAVLGAGAMAEQARDRRRAPKPLVRVEFSTLREIERSCPGCDRLVFLKRQGAWELTQPFYAPAAVEKVAELAAIAATPLRRSVDATRVEAAELGFTPPFATLKLDAQAIEFGATAAPQQDRYVRFGGRVGAVQDRFSALLTAPAVDFIDPHPLAALTPVSGVVMGQPMSAEALERWRGLKAIRIEALPPVFPGHT